MPFTCEILREKTGGVVGQPRVGSEEKFSAKRKKVSHDWGENRGNAKWKGTHKLLRY